MILTEIKEWSVVKLVCWNRCIGGGDRGGCATKTIQQMKSFGSAQKMPVKTILRYAGQNDLLPGDPLRQYLAGFHNVMTGKGLVITAAGKQQILTPQDCLRERGQLLSRYYN